MIIQRTIQKIILERINKPGNGKKIIVIYGARQVGKTTMVKQILAGIKLKTEYFNCDFLDVQSLFSYENAGNFESIVKNLDLVVLDEAQRIKNIGLVLKILHDEFPALQVIATGSSSIHLSDLVNEPLTGRKITYRLFPFSFQELSSDHSVVKARRSLDRILRFGSYPSVILGDDTQALENLIEITSSYLFKDISEFQLLKKPGLLNDLLRLLAFQISGEVSYTELAGKLNVAQTVIQRYLQLLEDSFIIFRLPALKRNLRNEVGKSRKIFFWDPGIRNMLIQNTNPLKFRNDIGALWENFCVTERLKYLHYRHLLNFNVFFWRTYNQKEIDYIEERNGMYHAFKFKWAPGKKQVLPDDFSNSYPNSGLKIISPDNFSTDLLSGID